MDFAEVAATLVAAAQVSQVCCDMWPAFTKGVNGSLPNVEDPLDCPLALCQDGMPSALDHSQGDQVQAFPLVPPALDRSPGTQVHPIGYKQAGQAD